MERFLSKVEKTGKALAALTLSFECRVLVCMIIWKERPNSCCNTLIHYYMDKIIRTLDTPTHPECAYWTSLSKLTGINAVGRPFAGI